MLKVEHVEIADAEFSWTFVRASGPGGQNVNKVASKAVLRWNVVESPSLPSEVKARLLTRLGRRLAGAGELIVTSQRFRDQERNRLDCLEKVRQFIHESLRPPKPRRPTRPTRGSKERRIEEKKRRSQTKAGRSLRKVGE